MLPSTRCDPVLVLARLSSDMRSSHMAPSMCGRVLRTLAANVGARQTARSSGRGEKNRGPESPGRGCSPSISPPALSGHTLSALRTCIRAHTRVCPNDLATQAKACEDGFQIKHSRPETRLRAGVSACKRGIAPQHRCGWVANPAGTFWSVEAQRSVHALSQLTGALGRIRRPNRHGDGKGTKCHPYGDSLRQLSTSTCCFMYSVWYWQRFQSNALTGLAQRHCPAVLSTQTVRRYLSQPLVVFVNTQRALRQVEQQPDAITWLRSARHAIPSAGEARPVA